MPDSFEAHIALQRWRADLHDVAGKPDDAKLTREVADLEQALDDAKAALKPLKDKVKRGVAADTLKSIGDDVDLGETMTAVQYENSLEYRKVMRLSAELRDVRAFWRGLRESTGAVADAFAFNNFSEPSDAKLLGAQS
jgi:hypothetical protein